MPAIPIKYKDTLKEMPEGYKAAITNPPYLNKSVASRKNYDYPETEYNDVYKYAIDEMLKKVEYLAAIIPESFIKTNLFKDRLDSFTSINFKMFSDTEIPVCLALFGPNKTDDFKIYKGEEYLGTYKELCKERFNTTTNIEWKFNDKAGEIGISCLDLKSKNNIYFCLGSEIGEDIKSSSRSYTRVSGLPNDIDINCFIEKCNKILNEYRLRTDDIFLTAFRGLTNEGSIRRRLQFSIARDIMNTAIDYLKY